MQFEAKSYSMGTVVETRRFDAPNKDAAVVKASGLGMERAVRGDRGKIAVIGVKRIGD